MMWDVINMLHRVSIYYSSFTFATFSFVDTSFWKWQFITRLSAVRLEHKVMSACVKAFHTDNVFILCSEFCLLF